MLKILHTFFVNIKINAMGEAIAQHLDAERNKQIALDAYLAESCSLTDLEARMRAWDRKQSNQAFGTYSWRF